MSIRRTAVGIPEAIDATGAVFGVEQITPSRQSPPYQRPLCCLGCGVHVEPVNGYRTRHGTCVGAHFRLAKHHRHSVGCRFDFAAECLRIHRDNPEVITLVEGGYHLHLGALLALTVKAPQVGVARQRTLSTSRDPGPGAHRGRGIADILRLLERFAFDTQAQEQFTAVFDAEHLSWHAFCFDAATEVKRFQRDLRGDGASVPRLLVGAVSSIHASKSGDTYAADIEVRGDQRVGRPVLSDRGKPILPVIRAISRDQMRFAEGERIAAFGHWNLFGTLEQPTLWIGNSAHVVVI